MYDSWDDVSIGSSKHFDIRLNETVNFSEKPSKNEPSVSISSKLNFIKFAPYSGA